MSSSYQFYLVPFKKGAAAKFAKRVRWGDVEFDTLAAAAQKMRISEATLSKYIKKKIQVNGKNVEIIKRVP